MAGRMLQEDINKSERVGSLSPKALALFVLLIPKFNAHGKMNGQPEYIKGEICPFVDWLTLKIIPACLKEISDKTNVKWFKEKGLFYLQSLNWREHQPGIRRLGPDKLPSYCNGITPGVVPEAPGSLPPEVDVEVEVKQLRTEVIKNHKTYVCSDSDFETFWKDYPERNGKKLEKDETRRLFLGRIKPEQMGDLLKATANYKASENVANGFTRDPIRFLKKDWWKNWIEPENTKQGKAPRF